jgi:hypothetical protein
MPIVNPHGSSPDDAPEHERIGGEPNSSGKSGQTPSAPAAKNGDRQKDKDCMPQDIGTSEDRSLQCLAKPRVILGRSYPMPREAANSHA